MNFNFEAFVVDLDGVVYRGREPLPGARERLEKLREKGRVTFLTNNSTLSRESYVEKLGNMGIMVKAKEIYTSGYAAARYIKQMHGKSRVFVVGEEGLKEEMEGQGHEACFRDCDVVVVALDRKFNYSKLAMAMRFIGRGAAFIATNRDPTLVTERGLRPGSGPLVKAVEVATGEKATVVGKPSGVMGRIILQELGLNPEKTLLLGDRLETDIAFGRALGMKTALVLTGVSREEDLKGSEVQPHYILDSL